MEVKVIRQWVRPFGEEHKFVDMPHIDKLTPRTARIAIRLAFSGERQEKAEVWDIENKYGYAVYKNSARKLKW
jgi:hypothetical protein